MEEIDLQTYQKIFDMIPIGLGVAALTGKLLIYNTSILEPGGYTPEDVQKLNSVLELYYDPNDREKVLEIAKKDGKVTNYKVRFKKKNGELYYTLMSLRAVQFQGQRGWLATVLDIDEQVKSETSLKEKMEEVEHLNQYMLGRELKMVELKEKIDKLEGK